MSAEAHQTTAEQYFMKPGFIYLTTDPTTISTVLGSGVSVCIYDKTLRSAGMNHFLYPETFDRSNATPRFGNIATAHLIRMMLENGSSRKNMEALVFGGAFNKEISSRNIGSENIRVAQKILDREGILISSEDVGGLKGRKIVFDTLTSESAVIKVEKIRQQDWYPYNDSR